MKSLSVNSYGQHTRKVKKLRMTDGPQKLLVISLCTMGSPPSTKYTPKLAPHPKINGP